MKYTALNKPQKLSISGLTRYFEALIQKAIKIPLKFWPFLFRWIPFWITWISNFVSRNMATGIMTLKLTLNQEESRRRRRSNKALQANTSTHTQVGSLSHILFSIEQEHLEWGSRPLSRSPTIPLPIGPCLRHTRSALLGRVSIKNKQYGIEVSTDLLRYFSSRASTG